MTTHTLYAAILTLNGFARTNHKENAPFNDSNWIRPRYCGLAERVFISHSGGFKAYSQGNRPIAHGIAPWELNSFLEIAYEAELIPFPVSGAQERAA